MDAIKLLLITIYDNPQARILVWLVLADLVLAVGTSLLKGDFRLARVSDFLLGKLAPMLLAYAVGALVAIGMPDLSYVRDAAFYALTALGVAFILRQFSDWGIPVPKPLR